MMQSSKIKKEKRPALSETISTTFANTSVFYCQNSSKLICVTYMLFLSIFLRAVWKLMQNTWCFCDYCSDDCHYIIL